MIRRKSPEKTKTKGGKGKKKKNEGGRKKRKTVCVEKTVHGVPNWERACK